MPDDTDEQIEDSHSEEQPPPELLADPATEPVVVDDEAEEQQDSDSSLPFPIVGIGASAGGVEAYIELFRSLSPKTGMAFVVVPHLQPDHKSHLVDILGRNTSMPVSEIENGARPEPNRVYILPPNARSRLEKGVFRLEPRAEGLSHPINYFFRSLATAQKTRAVGVVLSGTDADGALGLKAIKGEGGIAFVQSPESARFSEMPRSSISVDHIDRILPPGQIASELAALGKQFEQPNLRALEEGGEQPGEAQNMARILTMLRGVSGIDFRLYKQSTIRRRIARRMLLHRIQTLADYAIFVQQNPKELGELQEDALINVTRFFRDPQVFEALKQTVLPRIFRDREPDQQVRIWVAGCSSGEEVYSIAICLLEHLAGQAFEPPVQIFGTDASDINIQKARTGIYPESIAGEVAPERLRRFFVKVDKGYQVSKRVRDLCIFARQNLCHDPPFSRMDLISCRNVLIYLGPDLQKQILPTFHYALRPNGYLMLGSSENIREFTDLFQLLDRKNKLFGKIGNGGSRATMTVATRLFLPDSVALPPQALAPETWGAMELQRAADRIVLSRHGPPGVVINDKFEILQSRGHTSPYMEMPQGAITLQLPRLLRQDIASKVMEAVRRAVEQDIPIRVEVLRSGGDEDKREITLEVLPIHTMAPRIRCFLVLFTPAESTSGEGQKELVFTDGHDRDQVLQRLGQELAATKLYSQMLLEERDAKNQELVSANEEIQSANEEMQSINEELETAKEELQSANEELQTLNDELQQRNAALTQTTNDFSNLLNSVNLPVLMLNNELLIRHFTPPMQRLMNLRPPDIGRPFSEIRLNLVIDDLEPVFHEVLESLTPREMEVRDKEAHWYLLRIRPYRTTENKIDGLVMVLLDIDQLRRTQQGLRAARDFARSVIESVPLPVAVADLDLRIHSANDAFRKLAASGTEDLEKRSLVDLAAAAWGLDEPLRTHLQEFRNSRDFGKKFEIEHRTPGENPRSLRIRACLLHPDGEPFLLVTVEDITAHRESERLLSAEGDRLAGEVKSTAQELGRTQDQLQGLASSLLTSQEDERRRVARELHDDICQRLAVLEIDVQGIEPLIAGSPEEAARQVERARGDIASLSEAVRGISHALHPSAVDDLGIAPALRALAMDFQEREDMIVTFSADDVLEDLPANVATGLYRITQEALRNVAKHAGRTHVKIMLKAIPKGLQLQVSDSGQGFNVQARRTGLGLVSMEERARMMEGTFNVASKPGDGTRITVDVPL